MKLEDFKENEIYIWSFSDENINISTMDKCVLINNRKAIIMLKMLVTQSGYDSFDEPWFLDEAKEIELNNLRPITDLEKIKYL